MSLNVWRDFIEGLFLNWGGVTSSIFRRCKANSSWDCVRICATDTPGCGGEIHFKQGACSSGACGAGHSVLGEAVVKLTSRIPGSNLLS